MCACAFACVHVYFSRVIHVQFICYISCLSCLNVGYVCACAFACVHVYFSRVIHVQFICYISCLSCLNVGYVCACAFACVHVYFSRVIHVQFICYISCLSCLNEGYGRSVNHTFVDEVFGGELISTVVCKQCGQVGSWVGLLRALRMPLGGSWGRLECP